MSFLNFYQSQDINKCSHGCRKGLAVYVVEDVDWYSHCRNQFRGFLLTVKKNGSVF